MSENKFRAECGAVTLIEDDPTVEWLKFIAHADFCGIPRDDFNSYQLAWWTDRHIVWHWVTKKEIRQQPCIRAIEDMMRYYEIDARRILNECAWGKTDIRSKL